MGTPSNPPSNPPNPLTPTNTGRSGARRASSTSLATVASLVGDATTPVFVDTSGWADPILQNTPAYEDMVACYRELMDRQQRLITTNYVLTEVVALLTIRSHGLSRPALLQYIDDLLALPWVQVLYIDETLHQDAWNLLKESPDKTWSWVDASSFVVMRRQGLAYAFTSDHHFSQAGFVRLPLQP